MRINSVSLSLIAVVTVLITPSYVSADSVSVTSQQVKITASVAPARYIIVDTTGAIQQIISNNYLPSIEPRVYVNTISSASEIPLSTQVAAESQLLLLGKTIKPGVIYRRPLTTAIRTDKPFSLQLKSQSSLGTF